MIRVKVLRTNGVVVIDGNKSYIFNRAGLCTQEDAGLTPQYTTGMLEVPIISVLSSSGYTELFVFYKDGDEKKYKTKLSPIDCAMKLQMLGGFTRLLRRDGKKDDVAYNQLIVVYKSGTNLDSIISSLDVEEVK